MEPKALLRLHPSIRDSIGMVVWPLLGIFPGLWLLRTYVWKSMQTPTMIVAAAILLLIPAYAWLRKYFFTFVVLDSSVYARRGLLSKNINEVRLADIRAINVRQSVLERLLGIGNIGFSSAAGDTEEVIFHGVPDPEGVKRLVQQAMPEHRKDQPNEDD